MARFLNAVKCRPVLTTAAICGLIGFLLGTWHSTWQDAVEGAQVVSGLVEYPLDNPFYIYQSRAWTLLHQIPALFLRLGVNEIILSIFFSGFLGILSFLAIGLTCFSFSRSILFSVFAPVFILATHIFSYSANYPIYLLGAEPTYGMAGLSLLLLTISLLALEHFRLGAFLLALLPGVHLSLGLLGWLTCAASWLIHLPERMERKNLMTGFTAGIMILAMSLFFQINFIDLSPIKPISSDALQPYFTALIQYHDGHRAPIPWTNGAVRLNLFLILTSLILLRTNWPEIPKSGLRLLRFLLPAAGIGVIGMLISWIPPKDVHPWLLTAMPGRFLNLGSLAFASVLMGIFLVYRRKKIFFLFSTVFIAGMILIVKFLSPFQALIAYRFMLGLGFLLIVLRSSRELSPEKIIPLTSKWTLLNSIMLILVFVWCLKVALLPMPERWENTFRNYSNDPVMKKLSDGQGVLLTSPDLGTLQLPLRRAIVMATDLLDTLPYAPGAAPLMTQTLKEIYAIDYFNPPQDDPKTDNIVEDLMPSIEAWHRRTPEEWKQLAQKYHFTQIVTSPNFSLSLPLIFENHEFRLYDVPA